MSKNRILGVYGTVMAPMQICQALTNLRVSHSTLASEYNLGHLQPAWVGVIPGLHYINRYNLRRHPKHVLIICDSLALLSTCNFGILNTEDVSCLELPLMGALNAAIQKPVADDWRISRTAPSTDDYVHSATKFSYLNLIQTALYRISNYPLRKEVQGLIVKYLNSDIKISVLMAKLNSSLKLAELQALLKSEKAVILRNAVAAYKNNPTSQNLEATAKEFKTETFEIMYVVNSANKSLKEGQK